MKRMLLAIAVFFLVLNVVPPFALAQWDQPVLLTHDSLFHGGAQFVIDDSLRLHVFEVKSLTTQSLQPASLYYQRFDNWGNPLSESLELLPGNGANRYDNMPGVFLDRHQHLHVVWCRSNGVPELPRFFYARLSASGEILTPPTNIGPADWPDYFVQSGINMTETPSGEIWIGCDNYVMTVNEEGELVRPMERILEPYWWADVAKLSCTPDGHVWACVRYAGPPNFEENVSIMRVDTSTRVVETVSSAHTWAEAFCIDSSGAFHFILYNDSVGLYYKRDRRDGSTPEISVFDPEPYAAGDTWFAQAGDTLEYIWDRSGQGYMRIGYVNGTLALGPILTRPTNFGFSVCQSFLWKRGSYWIIGISRGFTASQYELSMLHIPGPNEPPNSLPHVRQMPFTDVSEMTVFPQPVQDHFAVRLPDGAGRILSAKLFNILGQGVADYVLKGGEAHELPLTFPPALPAGKYFIMIRTCSQTLVTPITHIP